MSLTAFNRMRRVQEEGKKADKVAERESQKYNEIVRPVEAKLEQVQEEVENLQDEKDTATTRRNKRDSNK